MGRRHTDRKLAMIILYQSDVQGVGIQELLTLFREKSGCSLSKRRWGGVLAESVESKKEDVDKWIVDYTIGWDIARINPIDKSILRVAFYELLFSTLDAQIILNEAIEISKKYSTEDSPKFINGILGQYLKNYPSRVQRSK